MKNKSTYERINDILKSIKNNQDKIVKLEQKVDKLEDSEEKFQARLAILDYYHNDIPD